MAYPRTVARPLARLPGLLPAWPDMLAVAVSLAFGMAFAQHQVVLLDSKALAAPWLLMAATASRVAGVALISYLLASLLVQKAAPWGKKAAAGAMLPLLGACALLPIPQCMQATAVLWLGLASFALVKAVRRDPPRMLPHVGAFALIALAHIACNGFFSPLLWDKASLSVPGRFSGELAMIAPLYKSYLWIKQFSLSDMDYSQWAAAPIVPTSAHSAALQLLALLTDAPSADPLRFYQLLAALLFFGCVAGSFGFYLYLRLGLGLGWSFAAAGGMVYLFANMPFRLSVEADYIFGISPVFVLPYALLLFVMAMRRNSALMAVASGAALASQSYILMPHIEMMLYSLMAFGLMGFFMLWTAPELSWKRRGVLADCCILAFLALIAPYIVPPVVNHLTGVLFIRGHVEADYLPMLTMLRSGPRLSTGGKAGYILFGLTAWLLFRLATRRKTDPQLFGLLLLGFLMWPPYSPAMLLIERVAGIPLNITGYPSRRAIYLAIAVRALLLYALQQLFAQLAVYLPRLRAFAKHPRLAASLVIVIAFVVVGFGRLPPNYRDGNPMGCPYYLSLRSALAALPLLEGDEANSEMLRRRLSDFESETMRAHDYDVLERYRRILEPLGITSVRAATSSRQVQAAATLVAPVVDGYYLNPAQHCVHPQLATFGTWEKRLITLNLQELYAGVAPFTYISAMLADSPPPGYYDYINAIDGMLGTGAGSFVVNASTTYDDRYMLSAPLFNAIYLRPGSIVAPRNNGFDGAYHHRVHYVEDHEKRKVMDISGIGVFMAGIVRPLQLEKLPGIEPMPLPAHSFVPFNHFELYRNQDSYGTAYLAHSIRFLQPDFVHAFEKTIQHSEKTGKDNTQAQEAAERLRGMLADLRQTHDIMLESNHPYTVAGGDAGSMTLRNMLGEAAVMDVHCDRPVCTLVYNTVRVPGWLAFVDGKRVPIERANFAFQAIRVPEGQHEVWFAYVHWSILLSLYSMVAWVAFLLCLRRLNAATKPNMSN